MLDVQSIFSQQQVFPTRIPNKPLLLVHLAPLTVVLREIQLLGSRGPEQMEKRWIKTDSNNDLTGIWMSFKFSKLMKEVTFAP